MPKNKKTNVVTEDNIIFIIELLNNIKYLAASYNQIWKYRIREINGTDYLTAVDDRTGEIKLVFANPDAQMQHVMKLFKESGWVEVKNEYLLSESSLPQLKMQMIVHAHWIKLKNNHYICSACHSEGEENGLDYETSKSSFCPQCGALMDEEVETLR